MEPMEIIQMFYETGVLVGRSKDMIGENNNYRPIIPIPNSIAGELSGLYNDLQFTLGQIQGITGLNDITDGSTPNPRTLVSGYENANQSTNNALYPMMYGERYLLEQLADDVMTRMQQAVRKGKVEGYLPALNKNILKFIEVSPDISLRDFGILLEERSTEDQKQILLQQMASDIQNGYLDTSDAIYIVNTHNVKQAQIILSFKVKRNKQRMQAEALQNQQLTMQGQQQSALVAEQAKQQTINLEYDRKLELLEREKEWDYRIQELKLGIQTKQIADTNDTKVLTSAMQAGAREGLPASPAEEAEVNEAVPEFEIGN